jgi:hypothetical protein
MRLIALAVLMWALSLCLRTTAADAIALNLSGSEYWVVLASRQDVDQAVAAAQSQHDPKAIVVHATNGWFAAISGPQVVKPGSGRQYLDSLVKDHRIPKDAYLTRGTSFDEVVWTPPQTNIEETITYDGEHDVSMHKGELDIRLTRQPDGKDQFNPVATARYKGQPAFNIVISDSPTEKPASAGVRGLVGAFRSVLCGASGDLLLFLAGCPLLHNHKNRFASK